jgi:prophage antirepressor-like protein
VAPPGSTGSTTHIEVTNQIEDVVSLDCREFMTINLNNKDHQVKLAGTIDDPYFCGRDVCKILGYDAPKKALQNNVDDENKKDLQTLIEIMGNVVGKPTFPTKLGPSNPKKLTYNEGKAVYINEPGLYSLIMHSKAPFAKAFQKLVYSVILPFFRHCKLCNGQ